MSTLQSDIINSFIDQSTSTQQSQQHDLDELHYVNPLHKYDQNMYDLLLKKDTVSSDNSPDYELSNDNLHLFDYKFNQLSNQPASSTINPKQLNPKISASFSSSTSSISDQFDDSNSISSESDPLSSSSISSSSSTASPSLKNNNWSMNDEFKDAIATWISQNTKQQQAQAARSKAKSVSMTTTPKFQRTSLTKRRKSDSLVTSMPNLSLDPSISSVSSSFSQSHNSTSTPEILEEEQEKEKQAEEEEEEEEEKPFKCTDCPKAFRRSEHLKRHVRSVHSNIRPFPCKFCEKKFSRSDNLAQHLRTHNKH